MQISPQDFSRFARLLKEQAGIHLSEKKIDMIATRLRRRLQHYGLQRYAQYLQLLQSGEYPDELQVMIDHLTTNETFFFREPEHFRFLADTLRATQPDFCRIWCAAASTGEEPFTLAMIAEDVLGAGRWELIGSDISVRVLERARRGLYPEADNKGIPPYYLKKFALRGTGQYAGQFTFDRRLKQAMSFRRINLNEPLPAMGRFDFVFIRNVMIYFDQQTRHEVVNRVVKTLVPGGYIITSHSESLHGICPEISMVRPSVYRRHGGKSGP